MVTAEVSKVKIYTDKPILSHSDDILGRSALAENIAKVVKIVVALILQKMKVL